MMLYVFHVDVGRMMTFDMTVALSSVENLKDTIERLHGIAATNIVLLVSGGEMLTLSTQVAYYSAGTDTNPIYMFLTGDAKLPPTMQQIEPDLDLRDQVERCLELPAVYETVVTRAQLALRMYDLARDEDRLCERLVHEQHLQQQGWSAVVANMEDLTDEFQRRFCDFCAAFDRHLEKRAKYLELLRNFGDDLTKLARIPILPGLMPLAEEDFHGFDEFLDTDEVFSRSHAQQASVLMAAGAAANQDRTQDEDGDGAAGAEGGVDDKSSTSPNKKLKMGNEAATEERTVTSQSSTGSTRRHNLNLLQWITSRENHNTLKLMSDECIQGLGTFNEEVYEKLKNEVQSIIKLAEQGDVKEIKGLGERLCKLEEFKYKIKSMVQDQKELSTAFQQNQNRAINLRDASILPDLCASHQSQLLVMLQNHQKIRDHRRCIAKAKDELGSNLHTRLKRIVWIENAMSEFDNRLLFYHRCLRRAERHINIIEQIHQAPCIYVAAVTEVVRRKIFSGEFREWASKLADDFDSIHSEEISRRQLFNASFEGHFLNILFPGMNDMPPAFANENPLVFDVRLPNITKSDIDMLSSHLPDLASQVQLPDMGPVINFFVSRSGAHQRERLEELLKQQVAAVLNVDAEESPLRRQQRLGELQKEDTATGGCDESETDTEAFEQVPPSAVLQQTVATSTSENQSADTVARSTATERLMMQSAETLTDDNESSARAEVERLRGILGALSKLSVDCIRLAHDNLEVFRTDTETYRDDLQSELQTLSEKWNVMRMQCEETRVQQLEQAKVEHSHELELLHATLQQRDHELALLREQLFDADTLRIKYSTEMDDMRDQLQAAQRDKDSAVAEVREQLIHERKTEIESLRCRFKLMTSMERSPSDSSLEKLERPTSAGGGGEQNMIELALHETLLAEQRIAHEADKEQAIELERSIWLSKMNSESVMVNVDILKKMLEDKERQLEQTREKDLMLTKENYQLKTRLDALTNEDGNSWLKEKIEYLNLDKSRLEKELNVEKSRRLEMESSFAALRGSVYEQGGQLPRSKSSGSSQKYVVLESCAKGDLVFVVWSVRHGQFMVVQDSQSLYFVHGDSLAGLNLRLPMQAESGATLAEELPIPKPSYAIGRVIDKEYCQARKDENRYRVTRGSKFYRIRLAPLSLKQPTRRERLESFSTSISRSISQSESHSESAGTPASARVSSSGANMAGAAAWPTKDMVDYAVAAAAATTTTTAASPTTIGGFKERTISITSVNEEDSEPISLLSERCRYISVSEEEEPSTMAMEQEMEMEADAAVAVQMTTTLQQQQQQQQQSVITEQPTASSKLKLDLLLASADLPQNDAAATTTTTTTITSSALAIVAPSTSTSALVAAAACASPTPTPTPTPPPHTAAFTIPTECAADTCSPSIPILVGTTTSEDSDEYRSLEAKDDTDFPLFE